MEQHRTRPRLQPVTVEDVVQTDVVTAKPDASVEEVVGMMASEDIGSVVVVEEDRPVGIVTDRSIALSLQDNPDLVEQSIEEILDENLVTGTTEMSIFKAVRRMNDEVVRRLPIVDEDGTLEGIVTLDDILILESTELTNATEIIKEQSPRM
jgi:CBS domain-containing protein